MNNQFILYSSKISQSQKINIYLILNGQLRVSAYHIHVILYYNTHRLRATLSRIKCIYILYTPEKPVKFSHERSRKSARYLTSSVQVRILYKWTLQCILYTRHIHSNAIHPTSFLLGHGGRVEKRDTRIVPGFLCRYILSNDFHLTSWPGLRASPSSDYTPPLTLLLITKHIIRNTHGLWPYHCYSVYTIRNIIIFYIRSLGILSFSTRWAHYLIQCNIIIIYNIYIYTSNTMIHYNIHKTVIIVSSSSIVLRIASHSLHLENNDYNTIDIRPTIMF